MLLSIVRAEAPGKGTVMLCPAIVIMEAWALGSTGSLEVLTRAPIGERAAVLMIHMSLITVFGFAGPRPANVVGLYELDVADCNGGSSGTAAQETFPKRPFEPGLLLKGPFDEDVKGGDEGKRALVDARTDALVTGSGVVV